MPFTPTNVPPSTTPLVTIAFSGLILLRPGANNTCEIGVHKFNRDHEFHVFLVVEKLVQPNPTPPPPTVPRPLPPVLVPLIAGPLTAPFTIRRDPDPNPAAGDFRVFEQNPFTRVVPPSHPLDQRWAINFRGLHANAHPNDGVQPVGTLKTGVLYTPNLTDPSLVPDLRTTTGAPPIPLNQIASNLGVSIDVPITTPQTGVALEWRDQGDPVSLVLPRPRDDASTTKYTIYFINEPPIINAEDEDEFANYYRVLEIAGAPIPTNQRFQLHFATGTRTDEIPCAPGTLNP